MPHTVTTSLCVLTGVGAICDVGGTHYAGTTLFRGARSTLSCVLASTALLI